MTYAIDICEEGDCYVADRKRYRNNKHFIRVADLKFSPFLSMGWDPYTTMLFFIVKLEHTLFHHTNKKLDTEALSLSSEALRLFTVVYYHDHHFDSKKTGTVEFP